MCTEWDWWVSGATVATWVNGKSRSSGRFRGMRLSAVPLPLIGTVPLARGYACLDCRHYEADRTSVSGK